MGLVGVGCFSIQLVVVFVKCNSVGGCPSQNSSSMGFHRSNGIVWVVED